MTSLRENGEHLLEEWKRLNYQWDLTSGEWTDSAKYRFEREFWQVYEPSLSNALKTLEQLAQVIDQSRRDVK